MERLVFFGRFGIANNLFDLGNVSDLVWQEEIFSVSYLSSRTAGQSVVVHFGGRLLVLCLAVDTKIGGEEIAYLDGRIEILLRAWRLDNVAVRDGCCLFDGSSWCRLGFRKWCGFGESVGFRRLFQTRRLFVGGSGLC